MTRVLRTLEDLDAGWLSGALGAPVSAWRAEPVGTGQMADSFRLTLDHGEADRLPASVVLKLASSDPTSRSTGQALRAYEVEVRIYRELAGRMAARLPTCHAAAVDEGGEWFTLLLEDMAPSRQGDQLEGCTPDVAVRCAEELARLHAPFWADPHAESLDWLNRTSPHSIAFTAGLVASLWPGFAERYAEHLSPEEVAVCEALVPRLEPLMGHRPGPLGLTHGDYRLDNLLLRPGGERDAVAVVDWQTANYGPPLADLAYFMSGSFADPDERARHERDVVAHYLDVLTGLGVDGYGWDACWHDYRLGTFHAVIMAVASSMLVERTERGDAMFMASFHRGCAHVTHLDALELLP